MITVYISIGNSDDKLSQREWSMFAGRVANVLYHEADQVHGEWTSLPTAGFQNACWCVELDSALQIATVRRLLAMLAAEYRQDSIAWAEVPHTEFIQPDPTILAVDPTTGRALRKIVAPGVAA